MNNQQKNIALTCLVIISIVLLLLDAACFFLIMNCLLPWIFQIQIAFSYFKCVVSVLLLRFFKNLLFKSQDK